MPIGVSCKTCEKTIRVRDDLAGKRIKCPGCGQVLAVPAGAGSPRATAPGAAEDAIEQARPWTGSAAKPLHEELPSAPEDEDDPTPRKSKKKRRPPAPTFVSANRWWFVGGGAGTVFLVALVIVLVVVAGRDPAPPAPGPQVAVAEPQPAPAQPDEKAPDAGAVKSPFALPEPSVNPPAPQPMPKVAPPKAPQKGPVEKSTVEKSPVEKSPVEQVPVEKPPVEDAKAPPNRPPNSFGAIVRELTGHTKKVTALAFLPGGKRALTGSDDRTMRLWDLETGQPIREFKGGQNNFVSLAVSADGRRAYSSANTFGGGLLVWDLETGKEIQRLVPKENNIFGALALSPKGKRLLAAGLSTSHLFDLPGGKELRTFKPAMGFAPLLGGGLMQMEVALSADDRQALISDTSAVVRVYDIAGGRIVRQFGSPKDTDMWLSAVFSSDARFVLSGSGGNLTINNRVVPIDFGVRLWDARTGKMLKHCQGHSADVRSLALSANGKRGLSAGADNLVILWNTETGQEVGRLSGPEAHVTRLCLSADGNQALLGGKDGLVRLWQLAGQPTGQPAGQPAGAKAPGATEAAAPPAQADIYLFKPKNAKGTPSKKVKVLQQDNGQMSTSAIGEGGVIGFAETSPGVVAFGVLIPGSTEIHVTVNRKLGYTTVADLRFLDDAVVDLLVNGMVQVNQAGIRARHATGVLYVSQAIDIGGRKAFVMIKQGPAAGK